MGFHPTHNGQYDGYHEMTYQQQGVGYPSHMQTCSSAGSSFMMSVSSSAVLYWRAVCAHAFHSWSQLWIYEGLMEGIAHPERVRKNVSCSLQVENSVFVWWGAETETKTTQNALEYMIMTEEFIS